MKTCKHCNRKVTGSHDCESAKRTISHIGDFVSDMAESLFSSSSGGYDGGCDSGSDSGSCGD